LRGLQRRPAQHVAQQKGCTLPGRQQLDGGDEGQPHGFVCLVARVRAGLAVDKVRQLGVGVGLQPGELGGWPGGGTLWAEAAPVSSAKTATDVIKNA